MSKPTKADCNGCYNDDYNRGLGGSKECWSFVDAKMEKKYDIHINHVPPFRNLELVARPTCYKAQRWVRVDASGITKEGFWK